MLKIELIEKDNTKNNFCVTDKLTTNPRPNKRKKLYIKLVLVSNVANKIHIRANKKKLKLMAMSFLSILYHI